MKHLVIGDCHVKHDQDLTRFSLLGKLIVDEKPDKIICLGDFADMESLCTYDKGTKGFEGRRYNKDVAAVRHAQRILFQPLHDYNNKRADQHKKKYNPELHMCLGNHEHRIERAINAEPILDGTIGYQDLWYKEYGWEVHDFLDILELDGVHYSHYLVSGVMGRPIGGLNHANALLRNQHKSCTVGHSHTLDFAVQPTASNRPIMGLSAGCFLDHKEAYAGPANYYWWRGVVLKRHVIDGVYDPQFLSLFSLKERYNT